MEFKQVFVIVACVLVFVFGWLLASLKNQKSRANHYLAFFMGMMFLQYLLKSFEGFSYPQLTMVTYLFIIPLMLSTTPFIFMYTQKLTNQKSRFTHIKFLHFVPALTVLLINIFSYGFIPYSDKILLASGVVKNPDILSLLNVYVTTYDISQYLYDLQAIFYGFLMLRLISRHKSKISEMFSYRENISLSWIQLFVIVFLAVSVIEILMYSFVEFIAKAGDDPSGMTVSLLTVYEKFTLGLAIAYNGFLGFFGMKQTDIYQTTETRQKIPVSSRSITQVEKTPDTVEVPIIPEIADTDKKTYKFELSEEQKTRILNDILEIMEKKKLYLNSRLTLIDVADAINTNKNYVSNTINEKLKKNFFQFVNEYRIKEALSLMDNSLYDNYSIEGIAHSSGFNSKSVFNPAFKQYTGKTPSEYRNNPES
ncbi:MAG: AraC family transcriptional regulator [Bacteroidetes bacterium]|nr:AraC family transcriptional regulator [Bacteroidota bacterium]MBU1720857.1 AraC family transcriptional regulator [Bacteroidota bacterium]